MPKLRKHAGKSRKSTSVTLSNKLGGRKSAKTVSKVSTADLLSEYRAPKRARDKNKILAELLARKVDLSEPAPVADAS